MKELMDKWDSFKTDYKNSRRWFIVVILAVFGMLTPYTIDAYSESRSSVKIEDLQEYVTTEEMMSWLLMEMEYVKKIVLMDKTDISDSIINEVFENHEWILKQFMEYNPRSPSNKPDYANILRSYGEKNGSD